MSSAYGQNGHSGLNGSATNGAVKTPHRDAWYEVNQHALLVALGRVRAALERHAADPATPPEAQPDPETGAVPEMNTRPPAGDDAVGSSALATLCAAFDLSPFERDVLLLCAGADLDAGFAACCAAAQGAAHDPRRAAPTFGLALAALPEAHWSALAPAAPLRRWRLIELGTGATLTTSPLRIDERILHYLTGVNHLDERLLGLVEALERMDGDDLPESRRALAGRIARLWRPAAGKALPLLCGGDAAARRAIVAAAGEALGIEVYALRAAHVPASATEREALARLWEREAILSGAALLLEGDDTGAPEQTRAAVALAERLRGRVVAAGDEPPRVALRPAVRLDVEPPSAAEQRTLWQWVLGPLAPSLDQQIDSLAAQFSLGAQDMRAARAAALDGTVETSTSGGADTAALGARLWEVSRAQARPRLDDLAQRIVAAATWDDLVLPQTQRQTLRDIAAHVRQRARVYEQWGFAARGARGLGISALFAGASGTGKTMAAEVLANALRLDLYRIDLAAVVSKYIGETEKNLRRVFDAAEAGGALLLFDEADALFGKRGEVKDSHDRYANMEVSYLLQRMEAYRGLAVLTTNMKDALDPAFARRIRFIAQFPFPDAAERVEIWRRIFPAATPTQGLDLAKLARLNLAGGNIRNIALNAAFLAADAGEPVRMAHLARAARAEFTKLERPLAEAEIGGWG